jgi:hypothetical protein
VLRFLLRSAYAGSGETGRLKRTANRRALATLLGRASVPREEITSRVSVQPGGAELRDRSGAEEGFRSERL